jgi:nucleotide-binding universal stress UspA family protein
MTDARPVLIAYDGTPAGDRAIRESGALLAPRPAIVLTVYEQGVGMELLEAPPVSLGFAPATLDIRTALEIDRALAEHAQRLAQHGAHLAHEAGYDAEGLAIAEDRAVADTIVREAQHRDAAAIVTGAHRHGALSELVLGSVSRAVIRTSDRPVVVVREVDPTQGDSPL